MQWKDVWWECDNVRGGLSAEEEDGGVDMGGGERLTVAGYHVETRSEKDVGIHLRAHQALLNLQSTRKAAKASLTLS